MTIDVETKGQPGWYMQRLARQLVARRPRFDLLHAWYTGEPPIDTTDANYLKYRELVRQSRTNFAALAVDAPRERMRVRAIRTSVDGDLEGDEIALGIWKANNLPVESSTAHRYMGEFGLGYSIVGMPASGDTPLITIEDPRQVITLHDPVTREVTAALKMWHDDAEEQDVVALWLPGHTHYAVRDRKARARTFSFSVSGFTFDQTRDETYDPDFGVPVFPFELEDGRGAFEPHLGLLERIDRGTFRRDTIALLQAFRQRAVKGDLPEKDEAGKEIDYDNLFAADPGALWQLPEGVEMWESQAADLTPLQVSKRDDVKEFAAVTRTPLSMITPDAAAQSAEGASLQREGLVFKVEDWESRAGHGWARTVSSALRMKGEKERADLQGLVIEWMPAERHSLGERGSAAVAAKNSGVPWRTVMTDIWGFDTEKVERMETERSEDLLFVALDSPETASAGAGG